VTLWPGFWGRRVYDKQHSTRQRKLVIITQPNTKVTFLPLRVGVLMNSENSDKGPTPYLFLAATANLNILLNVSCLLNVQHFERPAIFGVTNDSKFKSELLQ